MKFRTWYGLDNGARISISRQGADISSDPPLPRLGLDCVLQLRKLHTQRICESIERRALTREAHWTESLAVGAADYVAAAQETLKEQRRNIQLQYLDGSCEDADTCTLREAQTPYKAIRGAKIVL